MCRKIKRISIILQGSIIFYFLSHTNTGDNMSNKSIWEDVKIKVKKKNMESEITTDILIIGCGITGLTTAYFLKDIDKKVILIDKGKVGSGITSKTTAKISYLQENIYTTLTNNFNIFTAKNYLDSQLDAINLIKSIIEKNKIECDFKKVDSILFTNEKINIDKLNKEKELLEKWNIPTKDIISNDILKGFSVSGTYTFHPLKYLNGLVKIINKNIDIYENVIATNILKEKDSYKIETNNGVIYAKTVVVACHYPFFIIPTMIPLKTYIQREYVNATKINNKYNYTLINVDNNLLSIRYYKDYIIFGSNKHRLTSKIDYKENYDKSRNDFKNLFHKNIEFTWMNQDIMSNDNLPFIGLVKDNLYISTAYNAWGISNSTIGARLIVDLITNKENKYKELFNPNRINKSLIIDSIIGSFHYMKAYPTALLKKNNPTYVEIEGIKYGIFTDSLGKKHKVSLICPHMKCNLVFNREENTWDCPCHGSRFDIDGNIILGPSVKDIK